MIKVPKKAQTEVEPQLDPTVKEILGDLYKSEKILARKVEELETGGVAVTFVFPTYERTIAALDHVSMSQMHEAVLEGLYCAIGTAIKKGEGTLPIDFATFQANKLNAIFYQEKFSFHTMLKANEPAQLTFKVSYVGEKKARREYYSVIVTVDGFMRGEVECLLVKP